MVFPLTRGNSKGARNGRVGVPEFAGRAYARIWDVEFFPAVAAPTRVGVETRYAQM